MRSIGLLWLLCVVGAAPGEDWPAWRGTRGDGTWADQVSEMVVACYTIAGEPVWQRSPGQLYSRQGFCSSPILYKDMVILNGDQDAEAYLVALDQKTGDERWRTDRPGRIRSYCAPL